LKSRKISCLCEFNCPWFGPEKIFACPPKGQQTDPPKHHRSFRDKLGTFFSTIHNNPQQFGQTKKATHGGNLVGGRWKLLKIIAARTLTNQMLYQLS
jgi:hypothetical protein